MNNLVVLHEEAPHAHVVFSGVRRAMDRVGAVKLSDLEDARAHVPWASLEDRPLSLRRTRYSNWRDGGRGLRIDDAREQEVRRDTWVHNSRRRSYIAGRAGRAQVLRAKQRWRCV